MARASGQHGVISSLRKLGTYMAFAILVGAAYLATVGAGRTEAQPRIDSVGAGVGSGLSFASGQRTTLSARTPLFVDLSYRYWSAERPDLVLGASLRGEVEGRTSLGLFPRAELQLVMDGLTLRPGVAAALFVAPFTMIGVEGSLFVRLGIHEGIGLFAMALADAFFWGSDLPKNSVVLMFNGLLGVDLEL